MKLFKDYFRLIIFATGILIGVQVPNFIDQYTKRISAHYLEAKTNFSGYQQTADKHFGGSVEALLDHYTSSADNVFKDDAKNIKYIYFRLKDFSTELKALDTSLFKRIFHVIFYSNNEVLKETLIEYSSTVPLNHEAIICGLILGLSLSLIFEFLLFLLVKIYYKIFGIGIKTRARL
jgi:hypothetical protein